MRPAIKAAFDDYEVEPLSTSREMLIR